MHIHSLTIKNFRIFSDIHIVFQPHFNLIIGPNDSGKSAIIDALRMALSTRTAERLSIDEISDFHNPNAGEISIDLEFRFGKIEEAAGFAEWLTPTKGTPPDDLVLRLYCRTERSSRNGSYFLRRKAGPNLQNATELDAGALDKLQAVYLKPIRDAKLDLSPSNTSRLSRILYAHTLVRRSARDIVDDYKKGVEAVNAHFKVNGGLHLSTTATISAYFSRFDVSRQQNAEIALGLFSEGVSDEAQLRSILQKFDLKANAHRGVLGLGSTNALFMASELMLIEDAPEDTLKVALIEELEAHIHPMRELKIVKELQDDCLAKDVQIIATSHSPNLASKLKIENLLMCHDGQVYDFRKASTSLNTSDYKYLERFLDVTKSNMFFARGIIFVEGTTEQFLVPAFARALGYDLTDFGVTVVVVNHLSFSRFANIFTRKGSIRNHIPVAIITDGDDQTASQLEDKRKLDNKNNDQVRWFYGKAFDEEPVQATGQERSTVERLILSSTGALYDIYASSYRYYMTGGFKDAHFKPLGHDASKAYSRIENSKAPVAQQVSLVIDDVIDNVACDALGDSKVAWDDLERAIHVLFPNIRDAILHACGLPPHSKTGTSNTEPPQNEKN